MSPVRNLSPQRWLPRLDWIAKGTGLGDKSRELILPDRLAQRLGTERVTELRVQFPYDAIGLPEEIEWPYSEPHVCPTFFRLQVPRQDRAGRPRRPVVCMSDGRYVFFREAHIVKEPGFDASVRRGDPPTIPCLRTEEGHESPCPFSVPRKRGGSPPCTLVCQLHLLVPFPLADGSGYGIEAGSYVLEVPPSKIGDVFAQLTLLRTLTAGRLVGKTFLLRWEETTTKHRDPETQRTTTAKFFAPRFEIIEDVAVAGVSADQAIGAEEGVEESAAELSSAGPRHDEYAEADAAVQGVGEALRELMAHYPGPDLAPGSSNEAQRKTIRDFLGRHSVDAERLVRVLWDTSLENLSAAQAAAMIRWSQKLVPDEAAAVQYHLEDLTA